MAPSPAPIVYESVSIQSSLRKGDPVMQNSHPSELVQNYGQEQHCGEDQVFDDTQELQRRVLSVKLQHHTKTVPVEVIRKTFASHGVVERVAYSAETPQLHVLVQFQSRLMAVEAAEALQGEYIEGTVCQLEILFARESELHTFQMEDGLKQNSTSDVVPARGEICQTREHEKHKSYEQVELKHELEHLFGHAFDLLQEEFTCGTQQEDHDTEVPYVFKEHDLTVSNVLSSLEEAVLNGEMSLCNVNMARWVQRLDKEQEEELFRGINDFPHPKLVDRSDDGAVWNRNATGVISLCKFKGKPWQNLESSGQDETSTHLIAPQQECWLPHEGKRKQKNSMEHHSGKIESFLPYVSIGNELFVPWDLGNRMKTELLMTYATSNVKLQQPWDPGKNVKDVNIQLQASSSDARLSIPWDPGDHGNVCMKGILKGLKKTVDIQYFRMEEKVLTNVYLDGFFIRNIQVINFKVSSYGVDTLMCLKLIMDATYSWDPGIPQSITRLPIFDFAKFSSRARNRLLFWRRNGFSAVNCQLREQKHSAVTSTCYSGIMFEYFCWLNRVLHSEIENENAVLILLIECSVSSTCIGVNYLWKSTLESALLSQWVPSLVVLLCINVLLDFHYVRHCDQISEAVSLVTGRCMHISEELLSCSEWSIKLVIIHKACHGKFTVQEELKWQWDPGIKSFIWLKHSCALCKYQKKETEARIRITELQPLCRSRFYRTCVRQQFYLSQDGCSNWEVDIWTVTFMPP